MEVPWATLTSHHLPTNLRVPRTTVRLDNVLEWLTELRKALTLQLQFYYSSRIQIRCSQKKRCIGQILGGFQRWSFFVLRDVLPTWHQRVTMRMQYRQPRKLTWSSVCRVFIEVSLYRNGWITTSVVELNLQPPSLLEVRLIPCGLRTQLSNRKVGLSVMASPHSGLSC